MLIVEPNREKGTILLIILIVSLDLNSKPHIIIVFRFQKLVDCPCLVDPRYNSPRA